MEGMASVKARRHKCVLAASGNKDKERRQGERKEGQGGKRKGRETMGQVTMDPDSVGFSRLPWRDLE